MRNRNSTTSVVFIVMALITNIMNAQTTADSGKSLDAKQQSIVKIAALTATGDLGHLKTELNTGLDSGLNVNQIKEVLVQLYAYCGFPRSLNGIGTFMEVISERKANAINDIPGKEPNAESIETGKYERGRKTLEALTKTPQTKPAPGFGEFAPRIDAFLKEHLFADIFDSDILSYQERELATVSALSSMEGLQSQLQSHINMGRNTGLSQSQLEQAFSLIETNIGKQQAESARAVLAKSFK